MSLGGGETVSLSPPPALGPFFPRLPSSSPRLRSGAGHPGVPGNHPPPPPGAARSGDESGKGVLLPEQRVLLSSQE